MHKTEIQWVDYSRENLLSEYADYVKQIEEDKDLKIITNVLCLAKYTKPKINNGLAHTDKSIYIKTNGKIMTSTLLIAYSEQYDEIFFSFGNVLPIKFAKMESLNLLEDEEK